MNGICAQKLSFSGLENYYKVYETYGHNGLTEDVFIKTSLNNYFPEINDVDILDVGAGDGRNSIPIANNGYNVVAIEKESNGRKQIERLAKENKLKIGIFDYDITANKPMILKKFNFAFMTLVTQHFTVDRLGKSIANISGMLKENGILLFNALVRDKGHEDLSLLKDSGFGGDSFQEDSVRDGTCHFKEQDILDITVKENLELIKIEDYKEHGSSRPRYIDSWRWGMEKGKNYNRPVTLKWFVFKMKNIIR
ncbi:MAG: class I SAM-dependent methyltransferase [Candidatus Gastranaerophilales bacterium]|nr:class I SAM-dependent methyltransferase [Candidatus Gastranaerophilales bacterium]